MQIYKYVKEYEYKRYDKMNCNQLEKRGRLMYIFEAALADKDYAKITALAKAVTEQF